MFRSTSLFLALLLAGLAASQVADRDTFHFVILGDRTGETTPGVYERVLKEAAATNPAFILTMGDTIEGFHNLTAESEWQQMERVFAPYKRIPFYLAPGNHDVWNDASAALFRKHTGRELHYSFDYGKAHIAVIDDSRTESLSADEIAFLNSDLEAHQSQPLKIVVAHKPLWAVQVLMNSSNFELHRIAKHFGVQYVISGHLHGLFQTELDGVTYISAPSAGGNLRSTRLYEDGWFYGYMEAEVKGASLSLKVKELSEPFGKGRETPLAAWGKAGLIDSHH